MFPGFQFLPTALQADISRRWPFGSEDLRGRSYAESIGDCLAVELVSAAEMKFLFPDAELYRERVLGVTKSLVAIR
jgi:hypothetical protein